MDTQIFGLKTHTKNYFLLSPGDTRFRARLDASAHRIRCMALAGRKTFARTVLARDLKRSVDRVSYEQALALI